jgi:hypothetical protein
LLRGAIQSYHREQLTDLIESCYGQKMICMDSAVHAVLDSLFSVDFFKALDVTDARFVDDCAPDFEGDTALFILTPTRDNIKRVAEVVQPNRHTKNFKFAFVPRLTR